MQTTRATILALLVIVGATFAAKKPKLLDDDDVRSALFDRISADQIRANLHDYTREQHVAGTPANRRVAEKIAAKWRAAGIEGEF